MTSEERKFLQMGCASVALLGLAATVWWTGTGRQQVSIETGFRSIDGVPYANVTLTAYRMGGGRTRGRSASTCAATDRNGGWTVRWGRATDRTTDQDTPKRPPRMRWDDDPPEALPGIDVQRGADSLELGDPGWFAEQLAATDSLTLHAYRRGSLEEIEGTFDLTPVRGRIQAALRWCNQR